MTDLRKWSENAFVMLAGLKEAVQWELAPEIMKEIKELVDAYPVSAALSPARSGEPSAPQKSAEHCNQSDRAWSCPKCGLRNNSACDHKYHTDGAPQPVSGDAPKVEEIARQLSQKFGFHSSRVLTYEGALGFLRPYFPPASQTPPISEHVLNEIVLAICEIPDRTSPDDFPEAMIVTPEELRFIIRDKFEQAATPASTARTDALLNLLRAADDVLAEQSLINQRFTQKQDALFAELMGWRDANGTLAAPGSIPQAESPAAPSLEECAKEIAREVGGFSSNPGVVPGIVKTVLPILARHFAGAAGQPEWDDLSAILDAAGVPDKEPGVLLGEEVFLSLESRVKWLTERGASSARSGEPSAPQKSAEHCNQSDRAWPCPKCGLRNNSGIALCELCGLPMPQGEEMFKYHGYSGPCPKPKTERGAAQPGDDKPEGK